ncbi:Palmitoyltransferase [Hondaea fermentalgiana]|uniref:Palmitoyltransferase n=1 Tax=Hondaea fermentalgiana TaxID=2315210 RepID=A0A2R5G5Z9_9STRA|nr:Palmitoyltransferase [Hondaea fermentalgiana]|eukprot:GBG26420.1 Palmitoyltransferase [Hondaea fermentalgiana]
MPLVFIALDFTAFMLTGCTDPGVVTPQPDRGTTPDPSRRFCNTCNVYQDDNQRHCSFCNACVRELDHHCGVTGTCIGARNKVHFMMLFFYYMMSFWSLVTAIVYIAICTTLSTSSGFDGSFSPAVEISAHAFGILFVVVAVASAGFWFLAYFDMLGDCGMCVYRIFCCVPMARRGSSLVATDLEREPACGACTPCSFCTVPKREFYP